MTTTTPPVDEPMPEAADARCNLEREDLRRLAKLLRKGKARYNRDRPGSDFDPAITFEFSSPLLASTSIGGRVKIERIELSADSITVWAFPQRIVAKTAVAEAKLEWGPNLSRFAVAQIASIDEVL